MARLLNLSCVIFDLSQVFRRLAIEKDLLMNIQTFSLICDEYTDISNKEQLTFCVRWIDEKLDAHEDFLGFYNVPNISSETIVSVVKDALIRLQLSLDSCRGQCYCRVHDGNP